MELEGSELDSELEQIWKLAERDGLPLVELDTLDSDYKYLTLIYRNDSENTRITFEVFGIYDEYRWGDMKLRRLGDSDLHYRCYKVPHDICFSYRFNVIDKLTGITSKVVDPYNPNAIPIGDTYNYSYSVLDLHKDGYLWNAKKYSDLNSRIDTLHYTDKIVHKDRDIYVYLPPNYDEDREEAYPVIYLFDAFIYLNRVQVPNILDNLISEGKIEPMAAVLFGTFRSTRSVILPLNFDFKDEFVSEFLPTIREPYNFSLRPEENLIGGMSFGGLAGAFIGFHHPEIFGKVLSQSGSFWRGFKQSDAEGTSIRDDWLINRFLVEEKLPLKLYLDWGLQENYVLDANRRMVKVLQKKGYEYKFIEFNGWHDWSNSRKTFVEGLQYLLE